MQSRLSTRARSAGDIAALVLFALALGLPLGGRFLDPGAETSVIAEHRQPAPPPRSPNTLERLRSFPPRFEAWLDDRFGFRGALVRWHNAVKVFGFHVAPTSRAVLGPDLWVYTTANLSFEAYRGTHRLSDRDLDAWHRVLEARRDWLAERGIEYVFALAPTKATLYPEHLPAGYRRGAQTTHEQLEEYLAKQSDFVLLDLHSPLLAAKGDDVEGDWLYYPLGTHWTARGGLIATRAIFDSLRGSALELEVPELSDYRRVLTEDAGDSWAGRLHLLDLLPQRRVDLVPVRGWQTVSEGADEGLLGTRVGAHKTAPRLLLIHDSFGAALWPFLADPFSESHSVNGMQLDPDLVLALQPDLVVQVMAERRLGAYRPQDALAGSALAARAIFERARHPLARFEAPETLTLLQPWEGAQLTLSEPAESADEASLEVRCRAPGQGVVLPAMVLPSGTIAVLRIELTSNVATKLSLLYQTVDQVEYLASRALTVDLRKGRNTLHFVVPAEDLTGSLLMLPGRRRGRYQIHSIQIRATE